MTNRSDEETRYFLGVTMVPRNDWQLYFLAPEAASNIKDPKKVAADVAKKEAKLEASAATSPIAARLTSAVLLDDRGHVVLDLTDDGQPGSVSYYLAKGLSDFGCTYLIDDPSRGPQPRLFGLCVRDRLRAMALDCMHLASVRGEATEMEPSTWYHRSFEASPWCDPYEAIIQSDMRKDVDVYGLCEFLGVPYDPSCKFLEHAKVQAEIARQLAVRAGFLPMPSDLVA